MRQTTLIPVKPASASRRGRPVELAVRLRRMRRRLSRMVVSALIATTGGCGLIDKIPPGPHDTKTSYHDDFGLRIEYPEVAQCATAPSIAAEGSIAPLALEDPSKLPALELTLEQAVQMAVQQSPVLRTIGGTIVTSPQSTATIYDPGLAASSPQFGTEAALAAYDAQYTQQLFWFNTDAPNNVDTTGLGGDILVAATVGNNATFINELSKQTATGATFALRKVVNYTRNNQRFRRFSSAFEGWVEAEWRQPLMQGAGTTFNRIAGPGGFGPAGFPIQYNGVLIARVTEDVALADFEAAVIQLVADVEQAYWDLATAYRVLEATVNGREAAQQTYQFQQIRLEVGSGRSDEEAQARSQFYDFQSQVELSLGGPNGMYSREQRLRYLIGLPASDGRLIRPITPPNDVRVIYDWESALSQAIERRVEVRRQRFNVKRSELELIAARLNRRPRLDLLAQYRWRGLGDHLIGDGDSRQLDNLVGVITDGDFQEGQAGLELSFPVGLRTASIAVSNARLSLQRQQALLAETELRISHDLADAARQIALTFQLLETNYNRYQADLRQVDVLRRRYLDGTDNINFLLQAQRQVVVSEVEFYRALFNYNLAIRDFHRQKGSLLAYNQVQLAEGPWAARAAYDAYQVGRYLEPCRTPSIVTGPRPLTSGPFDPSAVQNTNSVVHSASPLAIESMMMESEPLEDAEELPPVQAEKNVDADSNAGTVELTPQEAER